jgi:glycosyltransferase involved in cell wall biosynthesis
VIFLKICILGNTTGNIDEGMKKITHNIARELSKNHDILTLNPLEVFSLDFWRAIKKFNPQVIHYIPGPSIKSFILVKTLSIYIKDAKIVMSAPFPKLSIFSKRFIYLFKPDLMLVQSEETERMFKEKGFNTKFLSLSGVDINEFTPVSKIGKETLRGEYGIDKEKFLVLHVGHIKEGRNIQVFRKIQGEKGKQVIIVGSTSTGIERQLYQDLEKNGCIVFVNYLKDINEIYALSDGYLFPTLPGNKFNSIEMPLSVLEAMSCNLPVISTRFGALNRVFEEGNGLIFADKEEDFLQGIEKIKNGNMEIRTREKVLPYSWEAISKKLENIYESLLAGDERE